MHFPHIPSPVVRLRVTPDVDERELDASGPPEVAGRRHGARQPYADSTVQRVRHLIENTTLTQQKIADRVGVKRSTVSVWQKNYGWTRPPFAPRCPSVVPLWRAGPALKLRLLTGRLVAIAERMTRELEDARDTDLDKLVQAFQVMKMARATAKGNSRRAHIVGQKRTGYQVMKQDVAIRAALKELQRGGVDLDRAPQEAVDLIIEANTPAVEEHEALRAPRAGRQRRTSHKNIGYR